MSASASYETITTFWLGIPEYENKIVLTGDFSNFKGWLHELRQKEKAMFTTLMIILGGKSSGWILESRAGYDLMERLDQVKHNYGKVIYQERNNIREVNSGMNFRRVVPVEKLPKTRRPIMDLIGNKIFLDSKRLQPEINAAVKTKYYGWKSQ